MMSKNERAVIRYHDCTIEIWVKIGPPCEKTETNAKQAVNRPRGRPVKVGNEAEKWLKNYLKTGPKRAGDKKSPKPDTVFGDSLAAGIKCNAIWRAAEKLGVTKRQEPKTRRWFWSLPPQQQENVAYAARDLPEDL